MRKKIASSIIAASLAVAAVPATAPATASTQTNLAATVGASSDRANESSSLKEDSFKGFMEKLFEPYEQMFSSDLETSSQGVTRAIINYVIIAAGVTIIGQAIQIAMANMPR